MNWKVFLGLVLIVIIGLFVVYKIYNKPHKDIASAQVDYETHLSALIDEFEQKPDESNSKYTDKVLMIEATMSDIQDGEHVHLFLSDGGMGIANCEMLEKSKDFFKKDETVKIKGLFVGYDDLIEPTITLKKCSVLN
ncbi:hypothetical protein HZR84_00415 [Hyphobacterium sp. CCMP332]|nr:hypothetical protein HZR84_00415 [Hyphobacterium sp. CCMP332]